MVSKNIIADFYKNNGKNKYKINKNKVVWTTSGSDTVKHREEYSYEQAIALAGDGRYNMYLLATLSLSLLAVSLDMFGFAVVVTLSSCEFQLDHSKKSLMVSMPFVGSEETSNIACLLLIPSLLAYPVCTRLSSILMAYAWGFISDTRGRRKSLIVAMTVSFVVSLLSAFSPNWIVLAVCKLISTCFCSCAQSVAYTLLGESCERRVRGTYMLAMTSVVHSNLTVYYALAYFIGNLEFSINLGLIQFDPWRLLTVILALPLGISALCLVFFYESPKFLLNAGHEDEALELLQRIFKRNGGDVDKYPVKKLVLLEVGNVARKDVPLLRSMWEQTAPLFRPPLLRNTLLLYYVFFASFSSSSGLFMWLPFLAESFSAGFDSNFTNKTEGLCNMIAIPKSEDFTIENVTCATGVDGPIVIAAVVAGTVFTILNGLISKLSSRKKLLLIGIYTVSGASGLGTMVIPSNHTSVIFYFGILLNNQALGMVSSYWVELYPTSFRGMASCLGVLVARISSVIGINTIGPYIRSHCSFTFYGLSVLMFSAAVVSYFLPPDKPNQEPLLKENDDVKNT